MKDFLIRFSHTLGLDEPRILKNFGICIAVLVGGTLIGAIAAGTLYSNDTSGISGIYDGICAQYNEPTFSSLFVRSILVSFAYFLICGLSATFAFGVAVAGAALFIRGLSSGLIAGTLCCYRQLNGFTFYIFGLLPGFIISCSALIYAASLGFEGSKVYFNSLLKNGKKRAGSQIPIYAYPLCVLVIAAGSLLDGVLGLGFYKLL
ncbi:MAG TPA: stage II sporulation protein M [Oscillospiraceae bacterium]|nr:stage II sporulation protein M [Oscillospiraceae bacterium]HPF57110.1 stage II sporulation protein M [Clostridiales bacterium]HPK34223.1 stage II sporulation protein M [Oscillospiraceae bacterium]HPR74874.1 stage II sporulation protein M [Oscillospiraceae bacterium]